MPIRLLSLDVTDTLLEWSATIGTLYHRGFLRGGVAANVLPPAAELDARFPAAFTSTSRQFPLFGHGTISSFTFWREVASKLVEDTALSSDVEAFDKGFAEIYALFQTQEAYRAYPDALPLLRWARSVEGLKLCVLSNATESYEKSVLPALGMAEYIDFCVISKLEGVEKPDKAIFQLAARRAEVELKDVLHVGNSYSKDYCGAIAAGCRALLLNRHGATAADAKTVRSLSDVWSWMQEDGRLS
ncbi:Haloacid dehalogenase-like hydrolase domain-containing protein 3 [Symbiodinium microadriaticum]|uniref:Haloacid dehalogenase-like hydrolase domain-containing protein 3 n=1 Tax=Symbiodinium microadriaticum TaxID=2951 RepID=A0A1Q9DJK7_SYMMI|nr:Haloacid dehalogenase-like hydrolase domain-containing protein 3 [Symbiodinium microadriaticum]